MNRRVRARSAAFAIILGLALGMGGAAGRPSPVAAIDPCTGYDLCVHLSVVAMGRADENGSGWVTSTPSGISCRFVAGTPQTATSTCDHYFHANFVAAIQITLSAVADSDSLVVCDWHVTIGDPSCTHLLTYTTSMVDAITFDFSKAPITVKVGNAGLPGGYVSSTPSGVYCGELSDSCTATWPWGTPVLLSAEGDGAEFLRWTGTCAGQDATCDLILTGPVTTTAIFGTSPTPTPKPTPAPTSTPKTTAGPGPTHSAAPGETPRASMPLATQAGPAQSAGRPASAAPSVGAPSRSSDTSGTSAGSTGSLQAPGVSGEVGAGTPGSLEGGSNQPAPTGSTAPLDSLPIVIAIIIGFAIVAGGIVLAALVVRRGRGAPG